MNNTLRLVILGICLLFFTFSTYAKGPGNISFNKPTVSTARTLNNIGNWAYWMYDDGGSAIDPNGNSGGIYPRGTAGAFFEDGVVWGGLLQDPNTGQYITDQFLRVGGQTYRRGTQTGHILSVGGPADSPANNRIYRIRSDWQTLSFGQVSQEAAEAFQMSLGSVTTTETNDLINQYRIDWNEWPVEKGAPFVDVDGDGLYNPILDGDGNISFEGDHPGIADADQVVYTVCNDKNEALATDLYGSRSIGMELQITAWAYNQPGAGLGQLIFKKYKLINKSIYNIDSMYVSQWCDPDLGFAGDDVVGCDTVLSLGYAYNGFAQDNTYDDFGLAPSAGGYDFFQGPLVPTGNPADTAIFDLKKVSGYVNLPMTSFGWFAAGSPYGEDPELGDYKGTREWYNLLRGFGTISDDINNPVPFRFGSGPRTGQITKFPLSGDPVNDPTGQLGDVDAHGNNIGPSDRRMALCSGPFDLPIWDDANGNGVPDFGDAGVQEMVVAVVGGSSGPIATGDAWKSVAIMKQTDAVAQALFNDLFTTVPKAPPGPKVKAIPYENSVLLEWGSELAAVVATEAQNPRTGYNFQGYNVYQLPSASASKDQAVRIATYDVNDTVQTIYGNVFFPEYGQTVNVPVQFGVNTGIRRDILIERDYINSRPLYPGNTYYFSVTAYNYNGHPTLIEDQALESSVLAIGVVPQPNLPGISYTANTGDALDVAHFAGGSDGQAFVSVVDPTALVDSEYEIFHVEDTDTNSATFGQYLWNVRRSSDGAVIIENQLQGESADQPDVAQPIADGLKFIVTGPPKEFKRFEVVANANGPLVPSEIGTFAFNANGFPFLFNDLYPDGTDRPDGARQQASGNTLGWGINVGGGANDGTYATFLARTLRGDNADRAVPSDYEIRFTAAGGFAWFAFTSEAFAPVPFEIWNIGVATPDDPSDDYRMIPWINDEGGATDVYDLTGFDSGVSGGDNDPYLDWIYWIRPVDFSAGTAGYDAFVAAGSSYAGEGDEVMARMILVNWNGGSVSDPTFPANVAAQRPEEGTIFRITTNKPSTDADWFRVVSPGKFKYSAEDAKDDVDKVNVFPNPYYAFNPEEVGRFQKFVTFNHLPANQRVTIRLFTLAGAQVRKLEKHNDQSANPTQFMNWDLQNESGLPVASGIYIAYIDMPDIGKTKVLKVFIVQHEEILNFF